MYSRLHREWRRFVDAEAGTRFQGLHESKRRHGRGLAHRIAWLGMGLVLLAAGIVMLVTPGPGLLTIALGAACLAQESLGFARRCDALEVRLRAGWRRWRARRRG